jgi:hypothetical protein
MLKYQQFWKLCLYFHALQKSDSFFMIHDLFVNNKTIPVSKNKHEI